MSELVWRQPCIGCGDWHPGSTKGYCDGPGGSEVVLDPDKVLLHIEDDEFGEDVLLTVANVLEALDGEAE